MDSRAVAPHLDRWLDVAIRVCDGRVPEIGALAVLVDSVDSESVDALFQPEPDCTVVDGFAGFGVVPVEIGLGFGV